MIKIIFFDRDGVLIKDYGYVYKTSHLKWLKGSIKAIKYLNKNKIKIVVVTNQSGVGRGFYSEKDVIFFHKFMNKYLSKYSAKIDKFIYSPFYNKSKLPEYKKKSNLRKPNNGMLKIGLKVFNLSSKNAFMIGDKRSDYIAAKKTKINFEFKKKNALDLQIKNIIKKFNSVN